MTDHNPLPRCPYCGGEMKERVLNDYKTLCFWLCPKCSATSPSADTAEEAYTAAMQRYVEPNRVLTMEEVEVACALNNEMVLLWVEFNCKGGLYSSVPILRDGTSDCNGLYDQTIRRDGNQF